MLNQVESKEQIDNEWVKLITAAKEMGLTQGEVRRFLKNPALIYNEKK